MSRMPRDYVFGTGPDAVMVLDARTAATLLEDAETETLIARIASRCCDTRVADQLTALSYLRHEYRRGGHARVTEPHAAVDVRQPLKGWYTVKQAAEFLCVTQDAVRQAIFRGPLPATNIEGRNYILVTDAQLYRSRSH
jgi:excisionase family DNA binding protein